MVGKIKNKTKQEQLVLKIKYFAEIVTFDNIVFFNNVDEKQT